MAEKNDKNNADTNTEAVQPYDEQQTSIKVYMESKKSAILDMLPKHCDGERYFKSAMLAIYRSPLLLRCTHASLFTAIVNAAELKLDFTPAKRQAYLVPYFNNKKQCYEAQFMPGYGGLIDLALRTGKVDNIEAHIVYEKDAFFIRYGTNPELSHTPFIDGDPGKVRGAYAIAFLPGGRTQSDYMRIDELDAIRKRSKAADSGPWVTDTNEMRRKTPVRRLFKYLPSSPELDKAIEYDNEVVGLVDDVTTTEQKPTISKTESVLNKIKHEPVVEDAVYEDMAQGEPEPPSASGVVLGPEGPMFTRTVTAEGNPAEQGKEAPKRGAGRPPVAKTTPNANTEPKPVESPVLKSQEDLPELPDDGLFPSDIKV